MPTRVVVVGAGFLGTAIAHAFHRSGSEVVVVTRSTPDRSRAAALASCRVIVADVAVPGTLDAALEGATLLVYAVGHAPPADAELDPDGERNRTLRPLLAVIDAIRQRAGALSAMHLSSGGAVYGEPDAVPVPEDHPVRPASTYAALKVMVEEQFAALHHEHGIATSAIRCANVYGVGQVPYRSQGVIATLLAAAASGRTVTLFGDGTETRDHICIDDVASAIVALADADALPPAINLGTGVGTSLGELVELTASITKRPLAVAYEPRRPTDLRHVVLDNSRLRGLISFAPTPLADGLERLWSSDWMPMSRWA